MNATLDKVAFAPVVALYTKPMCRDCESTKVLLRRHGIVFNEVDVTQDPDALKLIRDFYGFSQAPVVITVDDAWSGYQPDKIRELADEGPSAFGD